MGNTTKQQAQIVHEAIDERQYIRTKLPAAVVLMDDQGQAVHCQIADLSLGGMGLHCGQQLVLNGLYTASIQLDMHAIELNLTAKVKVVSQKEDMTGTQFVDLSPEKADILRYIISSYMTGEIADINGLFNVMQRENYIKERKKSISAARTIGERFKALLGTLFFLLLALLAGSFVISKLHQLFFVITPVQAFVSGQVYQISMPDNGYLRYLVPQGTTEVTLGQPLVSVSSHLSTQLTTPTDVAAILQLTPEDIDLLLNRTQVETVIASPCDCDVFYLGQTLDGFGYKGQPLLHLLPQQQPLQVKAQVAFEQLDRLQRLDWISLRLPDSGRVISARPVNVMIDEGRHLLEFTLEPSEALPLDTYRQPIWVEFHLGFSASRYAESLWAGLR